MNRRPSACKANALPTELRPQQSLRIHVGHCDCVWHVVTRRFRRVGDAIHSSSDVKEPSRCPAPSLFRVSDNLMFTSRCFAPSTSNLRFCEEKSMGWQTLLAILLWAPSTTIVAASLDNLLCGPGASVISCRQAPWGYLCFQSSSCLVLANPGTKTPRTPVHFWIGALGVIVRRASGLVFYPLVPLSWPTRMPTTPATLMVAAIFVAAMVPALNIRTCGTPR